MKLTPLLLETPRFISLVLVILLVGTGWIYISQVPPASTTGGAPPPSPREGFSAPDFDLEVLGGGTGDLGGSQRISLSELRGQIVMINLWASWCPPCRAEMPAIQNVYQDYKDQGLEVLAVNTTYQDDEQDAAEFVEEFGLTFPVLLDRTGAVSNRYQLRGLPSTFFVDREGVIRSVVVGGPMNEALVRSKIEMLMERAP